MATAVKLSSGANVLSLADKTILHVKCRINNVSGDVNIVLDVLVWNISSDSIVNVNLISKFNNMVWRSNTIGDQFY